jgi:hypothetical protein
MVLLACLPGEAAGQEKRNFAEIYVRQMVAQCGGKGTPTAVGQLMQRADLNGDGVAEWIVDAGRSPCPTKRPASSPGAQVTVFKQAEGGQVLPAFQYVAQSTSLERRPGGSHVLWLSLAGAGCGGEDPKAQCQRPVVWLAKEARFDLGPAGDRARAPGSTPAVARPTQ